MAHDATERTEVVELRGHIIDSLLLPKVLDTIAERGGRYRMAGSGNRKRH